MARNNSPARRAQRAEAATSRGQAPTITLVEAPAELTDRVLRRLCWRARGWAWRAAWR